MHPGFEQVGPVPAAHWLLWSMRLFDAPASEQTRRELAPDQTLRRRDDFRLTWHLTGTEDLLIVCLYDGSGTHYRARPRPPPTSCTLRNDNGLTQAWCEQP